MSLCRRLDCGSIRRCVRLCERSFRGLVGVDDGPTSPGLAPDDGMPDEGGAGGSRDDDGLGRPRTAPGDINRDVGTGLGRE